MVITSKRQQNFIIFTEAVSQAGIQTGMQPTSQLGIQTASVAALLTTIAIAISDKGSRKSSRNSISMSRSNNIIARRLITAYSCNVTLLCSLHVVCTYVYVCVCKCCNYSCRCNSIVYIRTTCLASNRPSCVLCCVMLHYVVLCRFVLC